MFSLSVFWKEQDAGRDCKIAGGISGLPLYIFSCVLFLRVHRSHTQPTQLLGRKFELRAPQAEHEE